MLSGSALVCAPRGGGERESDERAPPRRAWMRRSSWRSPSQGRPRLRRSRSRRRRRAGTRSRRCALPRGCESAATCCATFAAMRGEERPVRRRSRRRSRRPGTRRGAGARSRGRCGQPHAGSANVPSGHANSKSSATAAVWPASVSSFASAAACSVALSAPWARSRAAAPRDDLRRGRPRVEVLRAGARPPGRSSRRRARRRLPSGGEAARRREAAHGETGAGGGEEKAATVHGFDVLR